MSLRVGLLKMKIILWFFSLSLLVLRSQAQTYTIAGDTFHLVSTNVSDAGHLEEYVPAGQTLKDWTKLFGVRSFKNIISPRDYITRLKDEYHEKNPGMSYAWGALQSSNVWYVDFLTPPPSKKSKVLEWDFFRAETNAAGGIVVYQYAERRAYKKSYKELDAWDIKALRKQMIPILRTNEFTIQ